MGWFGDRLLGQAQRESGFNCGVIVLGFCTRWAAIGTAAIYAWRSVRG